MSPCRLTDTQFKLDVVEKDPYTLDNMDRPLFRGQSLINLPNWNNIFCKISARPVTPTPYIERVG